MKERINELEQLLEAEEITYDEFQKEVRSLKFFSHVYGMTQDQAVEVIAEAGYEWLAWM